MNLYFRKINIRGRYPFVRLLQVRDNPKYLLHLVRKNLIHKRDPTDHTPQYNNFSFLSAQQSLEELIKKNMSLARFSDGEFEQLTGGGEYPPDSDWCQKWSRSLQADLEKVLSSSDKRLLVAVDPPSTFLAQRDSLHNIRFEYNMWVDMKRMMWTYLIHGSKYGHSHLFVPQNAPDLDWNYLRNFLIQKDVIIATGNVTNISHLTLGRRTFFIECGKVNAYERKEKIKEDILHLLKAENLKNPDVLVLASLGPTAAILAYEFLNRGINIWDTGHMFKYASQELL